MLYCLHCPTLNKVFLLLLLLLQNVALGWIQKHQHPISQDVMGLSLNPWKQMEGLSTPPWLDIVPSGNVCLRALIQIPNTIMFGCLFSL